MLSDLNGWTSRISRAFDADVSDDKDTTGRTPRLDSMLRALESELSRYEDMACIRRSHPALIEHINTVKAKRQADTARIREYRDTAADARTNKKTEPLPNGWPELINMISVDPILIDLGAVRRGSRWVCPICQDTRGRKGTVDTKGALWHCFHCKAGGSHLTLLEGLGVSRKDAVNRILSLG